MTESRVLSTAPGTKREAFGAPEWGLLAGIALMWGSPFVLIAVGLDAFRPGLVTFLRVAIGAATLAFVPGARRPIERRDWPGTVLLGLVWMAVPLTLFPIAQQWISSALAGMLNGAMPLFTALIGALMLRRAPGPAQASGLLVGFAGVVAISWPAIQGASATALGAGLVVLATVLYGLAANIAVPLQQRYGALPVVFRVQVVAMIATLPLALLHLPGSRFAWTSIGAIVVLGAGATAAAFVAMAVLVGRVGATRGAVAIYFLPVVATILGVALRHDTVEAVQIAGMALVLGGAWLTSRRER